MAGVCVFVCLSHYQLRVLRILFIPLSSALCVRLIYHAEHRARLIVPTRHPETTTIGCCSQGMSNDSVIAVNVRSIAASRTQIREGESSLKFQLLDGREKSLKVAPTPTSLLDLHECKCCDKLENRRQCRRRTHRSSSDFTSFRCAPYENIC
jgi:hypothetical protein